MLLAHLGASTDGTGVSAWDTKEVEDKKTEARKDMPLQRSEARRGMMVQHPLRGCISAHDPQISYVMFTAFYYF